MAFANKIGKLFKPAVTARHSIFQAIRCMSSSKIFVGGLSYGTDEQSLREAFSSYGEVAEARIIMDRDTGRSRGFGFVTFSSDDQASAAIGGLDGKDLHGRIIRVNYATERSGGFRNAGYAGGSYAGGAGGYGGGPSYGNVGYDNYSSNTSSGSYDVGGGGGSDSNVSSAASGSHANNADMGYGGYGNSSQEDGGRQF